MHRESAVKADQDDSLQKHEDTTNHVDNVPNGTVDQVIEVDASPKRILSPSFQDQISRKKTKSATPSEQENTNTQDEPTLTINKEAWQGYCEIESEPAYFNTILREIGVQGVTVREVPMLDPDTVSFLPAPIFGLIMLFRARQFDTENQSVTCPTDVWFANQMPAQNSCATIAMIHALLNVAPEAEIDIGEHMRQFKDFTKDFTPYQRGEAFSSWSFVKKIHNSFAKEMDILENDRWVSLKARRAASKAKKTAAGTAANPNTKKKTKTTKRQSDTRRGSDVSVSSTESIQDTAHHYIAFVPINGHIYKLDGLDAQPTLLGQYDTSAPETWTHAISDRVMALMAASADDDYGLFAISQSPMVGLKNDFIVANATMKAVEEKLTALNTDWKSFTSNEEDSQPPSPSWFDGISEAQRAAHPVPQSLLEKISTEDIPKLLDRRINLVFEQRELAEKYMLEEAVVAEENQRAEARRWDYGPAIKRWVEMLAQKGHLAEHLQGFAQK